MKKNKTIIWIVFILAVFLALALWARQADSKPGKYDELAQCIADSGAKFYGAFWCPHCNNQKAMFGNSAKLLPYIECSTTDGRGQLALCAEAGVTGYPTWEFADGSRMGGEVSIVDLADKTGCEIPALE